MCITNFSKLSYINSKYDKTVNPLTSDTLLSLMESEHVKAIMAKIEALDDEKQKGDVKEQLPCVLYMCQMPEDAVRPKAETARPSGLCMHDWDHMEEVPASFYMQNIAGREQELAIYLVHITPRGKGLRLVTGMKEGETVAQCQERIANIFGMGKLADHKCKDLSRISFLPSIDYLLFIDKKGLFETPAPIATQLESTDSTTKEETSSNIKEVEMKVAVSNQTPAIHRVAESFMYDGIKYSSIIDALLSRIATGGNPREGERNDDLFKLTREIRHICEYNFNTVYMLLAPYFESLPDAEIRRTISNAIDTNGRTITPMMRGVINELKHQNVDVDENGEGIKLAKLPKTASIMEMIISKYPKHLRNQVYLSALPIWGLYGTHLRFDYLDGRENSLSFMTAVVGKSSSGKAFASNLYDKMTARIKEADDKERRKADQYLAICNKKGDSEEKPDDPRPRIRLYGDDITTSQFIEYLDNLGGEHGLQFTEEVARLQKAKRTIYGDNDDLYCKAFDNAIGGKESKSKLTRNIRIKIFLNTLFCGTPGAMHKFYNNPEGGLNNRVIFAFMPTTRLKDFPKYGRFTEEEQKQLDEVFDRLWKAGQDGKKIELPWLEKTICMIKNKWDKEDEENPNDVWYDLGKRAMVVAFRVGVLEYFLRDCPEDEKSLKEISKVVKWMADTMRQGVYAFSGKDYEEIEANNNAYQQQTVTRMSKNKKLFSLLNDDFTTQDLISLRVQNGDSPDVYMVLSRWTHDGMIRSTSKGHYHKVG